MKTLNVYPIDWNTDEHWIIEARDEFDWVEGMFHKKIINDEIISQVVQLVEEKAKEKNN